MFIECKAQSIDLSNFDTSNVTKTNIHNMFKGCQAQIEATDSQILKKYKHKKDVAIY